ncbi:MAG: uracil-DNA glycosylase [Patescibacteria group bacterium]
MDKQDQLNQLNQTVAQCQRCPLFKTATKSVPGDGNPETNLVFIGEAPGRWEDQKGIPFVGAAGNLLNKLLVQINLDRQDVFIANILKHRPPNNRDPLPDEIIACTPFLKQQLLIIKPKLVVTLGRFAMNYFIPDVFISKVHGQVKEIIWNQIKLTILPIYHPAAALRNGQAMRALVEDFQQIPKLVEIEQTINPKSPTPKQEKLL